MISLPRGIAPPAGKRVRTSNGSATAQRSQSIEGWRRQPLAAVLAPRFRPASFLRRLRAAAVLPWMRVLVVRGMARRAFFLRVSTLRRLRVLLLISLHQN